MSFYSIPARPHLCLSRHHAKCYNYHPWFHITDQLRYQSSQTLTNFKILWPIMIFSILLRFHGRSGSKLWRVTLLKFVLIYWHVVNTFRSVTIFLTILFLFVTILHKIVIFASHFWFKIAFILSSYWIKAKNLCSHLNTDSWELRPTN